MSFSGWHYFLLLGVAYAVFSVGLGALVLGLGAGGRRSGDPDQRYRWLMGSFLGVVWLPIVGVVALHRSMFAPVVAEEARRRLVGAESVAESFPVLLVLVVAAYLIWLVGVSVGGVRLGIGWSRLRASVERATATTRSRRLVPGLDRVRVVEASTGLSPFVAGARRPVLVVPGSLFEVLSAAELSAVVRHEVAHLSRRDPLVVLVQRILTLLLWFNPALAALSRQLDRVREECCDRRACGNRFERLTLATALVKIGETMSAPASCPAGAATGSLAHRVVSLARAREEEPDASSPVARMLLLGVLCVVGTLWTGWQSGPTFRSLLPLSRIEARDPAGTFDAELLAGRLVAVSIDSMGYRVEQQGRTARVIDEQGDLELSLVMQINGFRWSPRPERQRTLGGTR